MSRLVQRRLHPELSISGVIPCLYDNRLKLAREVLAELKNHLGEQVFPRTIGVNVKLAEAPSYGQTIFQYAPESTGARDYRLLAQEVLARTSATETVAEPEQTPEPEVEIPRPPASKTPAKPVAGAAEADVEVAVPEPEAS